MNSVLNRFVETIIQQTDGSREELADLREELSIHLELTRDEWVANGYTEKEAVEMAMQNFGDEKEVGKQLQQAMYPYRRAMLMTLSITSLLYAFGVYTVRLFSYGDAHMGWLILAAAISTFILVFTINPAPVVHRRLWTNSLLIIHLLIYFNGMFLGTSIDNGFSLLFTLIVWFILLLGIILVYRTTIYDYTSNKEYKLIHVVNITMGIYIILSTLFFIWVLLAFASDFPPRALFVFIPLAVWVVSYMLQMRLVKKQHFRGAVSIAIIQAVIVIIVSILFFTM